jgi:hypothetical protein
MMGITRKPVKKRFRKRLQTPGDVRRLLAGLINDLQNGEADLSRAGKIGYLANILVRAMTEEFQQTQVWDLEERIQALEKKKGV